MSGKANMISSSAGLKDSWVMVLHSWAFWKPVSRAMVRALVVGEGEVRGGEVKHDVQV